MPLSAVNFVPGGPIKSADLIQFFNLLTGSMTDQTVTLANNLALSGGGSLTGILDAKQIATPVAPGANLTRIYTKSDGNLYKLPNGGAEALVNIVPGVQTFLGANVPLNNVATYFSGPNTGSIGGAGQTLFIFGNAQVRDTAGAANFQAVINDGSTSFVEQGIQTGAGNAEGCIPVWAFVFPSAAATYTLKVRDSTSVNGILETSDSNGTVSNKSTYIGWVRLG